MIRLHTDEGLVGLGECGPHPLLRFTGRGAMQEEIAPLVVGADPHDHARLTARIGRRTEAAAVEIACWDLLGKQAGLPVSRLLGAPRLLSAIPHSAYVFFRAPNREGQGAVTAENYVPFWTEVMRRHGFRTLKCKLGGFAPELEMECVERLRAAVGPEVKIRIDPNGAWSLPTALRVLGRLAPLNLEYVEEPVRYNASAGIDTAALRRLRGSGTTPICADGCSDPMRLRQVVLDQAADVAMADLFGCGGIRGTRDWFMAADLFRIATTLHSRPEIGVGQAARLHVAAGPPGPAPRHRRPLPPLRRRRPGGRQAALRGRRHARAGGAGAGRRPGRRAPGAVGLHAGAAARVGGVLGGDQARQRHRAVPPGRPGAPLVGSGAHRRS